MATTPHYTWDLPTVGGDDDTWGTKLNTIFAGTVPPGIDAALFAVDDAVNNATTGVRKLAQDALPKAGGVLTGRVDHFTGTIKFLDLGTTSGVPVAGSLILDLAVANWFRVHPTGVVAASFANCPNVVGQAVAFILQIDRANGLTGWPAGVKWPAATAPASFSPTGIDTYAFLTIDGGITWTGSRIQEDCR